MKSCFNFLKYLLLTQCQFVVGSNVCTSSVGVENYFTYGYFGMTVGRPASREKNLYLKMLYGHKFFTQIQYIALV